MGSLSESWSGTCQAAAMKYPAAFTRLEGWQAAGAVADALPDLEAAAIFPERPEGGIGNIFF